MAPLVDRFVVPPFTVLDARQGYWRERRSEWEAFGIRGDEGRNPSLLGGWDALRNDKYGRQNMPLSLSIFDPVLCEVVYRWFCPPGGHVLDPFAGESTKGLVALALGYGYTGIELRQEQVEANRARAVAVGFKPEWIVGDSARIGEYLGDREFDLVFTSPPYYDLEVYSSGVEDGSALPSYQAFMAWYEDIFRQAAARLRRDRFLVVKVGEIRDKTSGEFHGFVPDNINVFRRIGLSYYNHAIFLTPLGTQPIRTSAQFSKGRKLGKVHQDVLVFYKGDSRDVKSRFGQ